MKPLFLIIKITLYHLLRYKTVKIVKIHNLKIMIIKNFKKYPNCNRNCSNNNKICYWQKISSNYLKIKLKKKIFKNILIIIYLLKKMINYTLKIIKTRFSSNKKIYTRINWSKLKNLKNKQKNLKWKLNRINKFKNKINSSKIKIKFNNYRLNYNNCNR